MLKQSVIFYPLFIVQNKSSNRKEKEKEKERERKRKKKKDLKWVNDIRKYHVHKERPKRQIDKGEKEKNCGEHTEKRRKTGMETYRMREIERNRKKESE